MPITYEEKLRRKRVREKELKEQGVCVNNDGNKTYNNSIRCVICLDKKRKHDNKPQSKELSLSNRTKRRKELNKKRICTHCLIPLHPEMDEGKNSCLTCRGRKR